jgi:hypothetical protein
VASLRAALAAASDIGDRRAGRKSAAEEPEEAYVALQRSRRSLESGLVSLRVRLALGMPDDADALVQAFSDRLLAADIATDLSAAHRHLLTLFPAVEAEVVEEVRVAAALADRLAGQRRFEAVARRLASQLEEVLEALDLLP